MGRPIAYGVTDDLAEAMRSAEQRLKDGSAFICVIEEVQTLISVIGLEELHASTGKRWNGRRNSSDGVHWSLSVGLGDASLIYRIPESLRASNAPQLDTCDFGSSPSPSRGPAMQRSAASQRLQKT